MDFKKRSAAADARDIFLVGLDVDLAGKFAHDAEQFFHGHRGGPWLGHLGLNLAGDGHVQVGGGELHVAAFRAQQDVGEDGQRGAGADDVLHSLQAGYDLVFGDREIHARFIICILL